MGQFADDVQERLRDAMAERDPGRRWVTEHEIGGTPVDVAGLDDDRLVLVELEWRRADPADNTAKLFRHLDSGTIESDAILACQLFTGYYDLASGGVSSKRKNAEFVGRAAERALDGLSYHAVEIGIDPPKRGGERPDGWTAAIDDVADAILDRLQLDDAAVE